MTAVALTIEEFMAPNTDLRFVKVRDVEEPWRVLGYGLVKGLQYDVTRRDGRVVRVRVERITKRREGGMVMAKFVSLRPLGRGLFVEWIADDVDDAQWAMDWRDMFED